MARKFNLIVSDCYHSHDAFMGDPVTTSLIDLVIADDALLHYADSLLGISGKTLLIDNIWHDHIVNTCNASSTHILTIAECYHLHAGGEMTLSVAWSMWTETVVPPKLPVPVLTANDETRLYGLEGGLPLPVPTLAMSAGMRCGTLKLPDLGLTATGVSDTIGVLDKRAPAMQISARGGANGGVLKLPFPQLTVEVTGADVGRLTKTMPGLSISATASTPTEGNLDKRLPTLRLSVTMSTIVTGQLVASLPTITGVGSGAMVTYGTLARNIPPPIVGTMAGHQQSAAATMTLPTLIMAGVVGAGSNGQAGDMVSRMQNTSRFTDYVLRYSR